MAYIGREPQIGNFQICDDITVVNGQAAYTMQVGGANVIPETSNHCLVSLNGILQKSGGSSPSFTVSGSTITFASNLATGDVINFIHILGSVLDLGTPSDGTVTNAKLAQDIISGETALTSEPASTDEFLISDAGTLKRIDYSLISNTPAFLAHQTSAQSIANTTNTKLTNETEIFDTDSAYDNSSNHRFTPQTAGKYFIFSQVMFASSTNFNQIEIVIKKNTTVYSSSISINDEYNTAYTGTIVDLNGSSDYVETFAYQNSGGSLNTYPSATSKYVRFGGYKLTGA